MEKSVFIEFRDFWDPSFGIEVGDTHILNTNSTKTEFQVVFNVSGERTAHWSEDKTFFKHKTCQ